MMLCKLLLAGIAVACTIITLPTDAFISCQAYGKQRATAFKSSGTDSTDDDVDIVKTSTAKYEATVPAQRHKTSRLRRIFSKDASNQTSEVYSFTYDYNVMEIGSSSNTTTAVVLIHPIGVGIGKFSWLPCILVTALSLLKMNLRD